MVLLATALALEAPAPRWGVRGRRDDSGAAAVLFAEARSVTVLIAVQPLGSDWVIQERLPDGAGFIAPSGRLVRRVT